MATVGDTLRWASFMFFLIGSAGGLIFLATVVRRGLMAYWEYEEASNQWKINPKGHTPAPWAPRAIGKKKT
jgi:hypothetical protein